MMAQFLLPLISILLSIFKDFVAAGVRKEIPLVVNATRVTPLMKGYHPRK